MANVIFVRGNTATINSTAIKDGQLLYDTTTGQHYIDVGSTRKEVGKPVDSALSTTSTNPVQNKSLTTSIINTAAEVKAITADYVPCGTKPVKELITNLPIYNPVTDSLDIYSAGVLVGSLLCSFQIVYLMKQGDVCASVTGGYTGYAYNYNGGWSGSQKIAPTFTSGNNNIVVSAKDGTTTTCGADFTNNSINLTGKSKLILEFNSVTVQSTDDCYSIGFSPSIKDAYDKTVFSSKNVSETNGRIELNISNLNGNYYFFIDYVHQDTHSLGSIDIKNIWLE